MIELFADECGIVLRRDVIAANVGGELVKRALRSGAIVRVRQGAYCLRDVWAAADGIERYRIRVRAVRRQYDERVALSHVSTLVVDGGPDWGHSLEHVHLTNMAGSGERTQAGVVHHRGSLRVGDVRRDSLGWLTSPARTALDTASLAPRDPAVCVLDWVQQQGLASRIELEQGIAAMRAWPDTLALKLKLDISCGRCESVGETRTHLLCRDQHLPPPVPQFEVWHPNGRLAARVDFAWPERRTILEFDGLAKYLKLRRPGESIEDCVLREKTREDLIRRLTGWTVLRIVWADLARPAATARMIRAHFDLVAA
jgi:hypothetical protein